MLKRYFRKIRKQLTSEAHQGRAMLELSNFGLGYIPWSGAAMRPSAVVFIVNEILINRRCQILELGSGVSTLFGAAAIAKAGQGHIHSIDQNQDWIAVVRQQLAEQNLESHVTFHHAPLIDRSDIQWPSSMKAVNNYYDTSVLEGAIAANSQTLMIVDAPTAYQADRRYARFPALQVFREYLADECTIILDDVLREGEGAAILDWQASLGVTAKIDEAREIGILATGQRWTV